MNHRLLELLVDLARLCLLALALFCLLGGVCYGQTAPKRLVVWTDVAWPNSRLFTDDLCFGLDEELAQQGWTVECYEVRRNPLQAWALGIRNVPLFIIPGRTWWIGYRRNEFRTAFGLEPLSDTAAQVATEPDAIDPAQLQLLLADELDRQRDELQHQFSDSMTAAEARQLALEQSLAQQQQIIDQLRQGNPDVDRRLDAITSYLQALSQERQLASESPLPEEHQSPMVASATDAPAASTAADSPSESIHERLEWVVRVGGYTFSILEALGILGATSTGVGAAGVAGIWLLKKLLARKPRPAPRQSEVAGKAPFPRQLDEARELLEIRQSEGRVGVLDQLRGMFLDDEVEKLLETVQGDQQTLLKDLMNRIDSQVDQIAPLATKV